MSSTAYEKGRDKIVTLIFTVYWLLLFEGVLRKWLLPEYQKELFFVRDPFVLGIYFLCLKHKVWPRNVLWTIVALSWMWVGGALVLLHVLNGMISSRTALVLAVYGWREYFFYIPLALVIGECFSREDLLRLIRYTLWLSMPVAVLVLFQCHAGAHTWINAGSSANPADTFAPMGVTLGYVRSEGTFTSPAGQALFVASTIAMLLWFWILPPARRPMGRAMLIVATLAALTSLAVGGQRLEFALTGIIVLAALAGAMHSRGYMSRRMRRVTVGLVFSGMLVAPVLFPDQLHALALRAEHAAAWDSAYSYGMVNRTVKDLVHFTSFLGTTPATGYGLAATENVIDRLDLPSRIYVEDDLSRNIVELGPILGTGFILFRIALVLWLAAGGIKSARLRADPLPLLLLAVIAPLLLYSDIGQGTENGYVWLFVGFCIAASRTATTS